MLVVRLCPRGCQCDADSILSRREPVALGPGGNDGVDADMIGEVAALRSPCIGGPVEALIGEIGRAYRGAAAGATIDPLVVGRDVGRRGAADTVDAEPEGGKVGRAGTSGVPFA